MRSRNAQRLLRSLAVVNPYAEQLRFMDERTRTRRDQAKYLTLIDAIALLHQHQRSVRTVEHRGQVIEYIEVTPADIALANRLAHEVLGRSLDELPPQTRRVLGAVQTMVAERVRATGAAQFDIRFSRRDVREAAGVSDTQARVHLERLVELEYLLTHRGQRGQSFVYELLFDGPLEADGPRLAGLIDAAALHDATAMPSSRGSAGQFAAASRPQRGANAAATRAPVSAANPAAAGAVPLCEVASPLPAHRGEPVARSRRNGAAAVAEA